MPLARSWALRGALVRSGASPGRSVGTFGSFVVLTLLFDMRPCDVSIVSDMLDDACVRSLCFSLLFRLFLNDFYHARSSFATLALFSMSFT